MREIILGISSFYHDSAAAILIDGHIIAAAHEERFTRKKHDPSFPIHACKYTIEEAGLDYKDITAVAFYDKPFIKFERLLETYHAFAPCGLKSFLSAMPVWIKEKLLMKQIMKEELEKLGPGNPDIFFPEHHLSHAASAFYPSPFDEAAILTLDGVGEWSTTMLAHGKDNQITVLKELDFPHSIGLLYSAFTYYCGFKVNSGEYKLMGLAPYGNKQSKQKEAYKEKILDALVDIKDDGSILLNMDYFDFAVGLKMCKDEKWKKLLGIPKRTSESILSQEYMDLSLAIQEITEDIVLKLAQTIKSLTQASNLTLAGGVALNCVANGKLLRTGLFDQIWIQPAAGDAGGAIGAAYAVWYTGKNKKRTVDNKTDSMQGAYLGPEFSDLDMKKTIRKFRAAYTYFDSFEELCEQTADLIADGNVIGWFQGRMEYGPRALGNRSIIGDARNPEMQKKLNLKIKYREGFRPFAPSVMEEDITTFFDIMTPSPYMLLVAPVQENRRKQVPKNDSTLELYDRLYHLRSDVPAITHVDFSARIQSVNRKTNPRYWQLINAFKRKTGFGVIVNTSFNVRGEPIVCAPDDAFRCFMRTEMDYLVLGNFFFDKKDQKMLTDDINWKEKFELD